MVINEEIMVDFATFFFSKFYSLCSSFEYSTFKKRQYRRMKKQETGSVMLIKKIRNIWNNFIFFFLEQL